MQIRCPVYLNFLASAQLNQNHCEVSRLRISADLPNILHVANRNTHSKVPESLSLARSLHVQAIFRLPGGTCSCRERMVVSLPHPRLRMNKSGVIDSRCRACYGRDMSKIYFRSRKVDRWLQAPFITFGVKINRDAEWNRLQSLLWFWWHGMQYSDCEKGQISVLCISITETHGTRRLLPLLHFVRDAFLRELKDERYGGWEGALRTNDVRKHVHTT